MFEALKTMNKRGIEVIKPEIVTLNIPEYDKRQTVAGWERGFAHHQKSAQRDGSHCGYPMIHMWWRRRWLLVILIF